MKLFIVRVERVLVENCLFNPFIDHVNRLICLDESLDPLRANDSPRKPMMKHCAGPAPRRLMHQSELCEGKFVSSLHCHPTFPGIVINYIFKNKINLHKCFWLHSRGHCSWLRLKNPDGTETTISGLDPQQWPQFCYYLEDDSITGTDSKL